MKEFKDLIQRIFDVIIAVIALLGVLFAHLLFESNNRHCVPRTGNCLYTTLDYEAYFFSMGIAIVIILVVAIIMRMTVGYVVYGKFELPKFVKKMFVGDL